MKCRSILLALLLFAMAGNAGAQTPEPEHLRDLRMEWWRDARFGMFIHWGLYAVPAGEWNGQEVKGIGEWIMQRANILRKDYEPLTKKFNPTEFDAAEWVRIAKDAGMKYLVITTKHHDGFAIYDSKVSKYDIVDATPFKRDPLAELARECQRQGVKLGFYHSILDWHHPAQYVPFDGKTPRDAQGNNSVYPERKKEYIDYMKTQLQELITKYDPAVLWFDGEWQKWWTEEDGKDLYQFVRSLKEDIIINNRVAPGRQGMSGFTQAGTFAGDFGTPEQEIPDTGISGMDWESCMTMNDTWGFKRNDTNWKSDETLIRNLIDIASKGGNFLLNVGPTAQGEIPDASVARLKRMGEWLRVNGEAIYSTDASPFEQPSWGRFTRKEPGTLYAHVFTWPADGKLTLPAVKSRLSGATLLTANGPVQLQVSPSAGGTTVLLPANAPDAIASVIKLTFENGF